MTPSESPATPRHRDFECTVLEAQPAAARPEHIETLMLNVGLRCDLACAHCHHSCSPTRTEVMSRETMLDALRLAETIKPRLIDITGGEPELFVHLRELVSRARAAGLATRVRTNLVALAAPGAAGLPTFFAENGVSLLASLPGVSAAQTAEQRGANGVWEHSLEVLRVLTGLGYGAGDGLVLEIAYNPPLGQLARPQGEIEDEFRAALTPLGVRFDALLALPNVPIGRYRQRLRSDGSYTEYLSPALATRSTRPWRPRSNAATASRSRGTARCGTATSTWAPAFAPRAARSRSPRRSRIRASLADRRIGFGPHCFACTAGTGFG